MLILFHAFKREIAPLRRALGSARAWSVGGFAGFEADLKATPLFAVRTGPGPRNAALAAHATLKRLGRPGAVVVAGVAGGLQAGLQTGQIVLADRLVRAAPVGVPAQEYRLDGALVERVRQHLCRAEIRPVIGPVLTADHVIATAREKQLCAKRTGAVAVEMESAAVAAECAAQGLRCLCLRAILDRADEDVVGGHLLEPGGSVSARRLLGQLCRRPWVLTSLIALARHLRIAARALAPALLIALGALDAEAQNTP